MKMGGSRGKTQSGQQKIYLFLIFMFVNIGVSTVQAQDTYELVWSYEIGPTAGEVSVSADGNYVAAGSEDNKIYFFGLRSQTNFVIAWLISELQRH